MKNLLCVLLLLVSLLAQAQKNIPPELTTRLNDYMKLTKEMNVDGLIEYMHPKLFSIAPKAALIESMKSMFQNEELKVRFDSTSIVDISPVFKLGTAAYHKIRYYSVLSLVLPDSMDLSNPEFADVMLKSMKKGFPGKVVVISKQENAIQVKGTDIMFAIKDPSVKNWMFLGYDSGKKELNNRLHPKAVRDHFKLL